MRWRTLAEGICEMSRMPASGASCPILPHGHPQVVDLGRWEIDAELFAVIECELRPNRVHDASLGLELPVHKPASVNLPAGICVELIFGVHPTANDGPASVSHLRACHRPELRRLRIPQDAKNARFDRRLLISRDGVGIAPCRARDKDQGDEGREGHGAHGGQISVEC
jgi:hypothetical protein